MTKKEYKLELGGRTFSIRITNWAEQANGSVLVQYGDTVVLATAVMSKSPRGMGDFFPLMVDYQEKFYSTGRIRGSRFIKREGRPADEAILVARMIDRSLRPLFDQRIRNDVQVILFVLSDDGINNPDIPAFIASSAALHISDIPWDGPVAAVRVAKDPTESKEEWILNPPQDLLEQSPFEIFVAGTKDYVNMLEGGGKEVAESDVQSAVEFGHENLKALIDFQNEIRKDMGKEKIVIDFPEENEEVLSLINGYKDQLIKAMFREDKAERNDALDKLQEEILEKVKETYPDSPEYSTMAENMLDAEIERLVQDGVEKEEKRVDGRNLDELRPISGEVGVLPRTHGSSMFFRGLTHTLSTVSLGAPSKSQIIEDPRGEYKKYFMHHYAFPNFSVGEAGPTRSPGRREIGHGALAERALLPVIPSIEEFPYTIRLVSETLSSNGSSSMAAVCASTLSLMDAGVPIKRPVAGIAIGLMGDRENFKILTDIQGPEDHYGDMDFKVAGTTEGITAIQMDVKMKGITPDMLKEALERGRVARNKILDIIKDIIPVFRPSLSPFAPAIETMKINPDKIGAVIGGGGKIINEIIEKTETQIDIEDDGSIFLTGTNKEKLQEAREWIEGIVHEVKIGDVYDVEVVRVEDFGAFVEFLRGKQGLVHVSELADDFVKNTADIVKIGDKFQAKVIKIDDSGKIGLSKKRVNGK